MSAKLVSESTGREHEVVPEGTTIGRHSDNDIALPGRSVSRFHAEISLGEKGWLLEDHGSTYGTFINGQKVEGVVDLADGDKVRIAVSKSAPDGEFNFVFRCSKGGIGDKLKRAARAIVNRKKVELGHLVFERNAGVLLVRMTGIFRRREIDALAKGVNHELAAGGRMVVLDLREVKYMNSYGLACLVQLGTSQKEEGSSLRVFGAAGTVLKLLKLVGSESPIEIAADEGAALA
ncbi:MAG: FHA domain-containing protein [Planctomycetota bacterium]